MFLAKEKGRKKCKAKAFSHLPSRLPYFLPDPTFNINMSDCAVLLVVKDQVSFDVTCIFFRPRSSTALSTGPTNNHSISREAYQDSMRWRQNFQATGARLLPHCALE